MGLPPWMRLPILYQDEWLVAVDKPAGINVHADEMAPRRDNCLRRLRSQLGRWVFPCHRLDCATSGVLLFAFSGQLARPVFEAFEKRKVDKLYWALCRGYLQPGQERLQRSLDGRPAETAFHNLQQYSLPMAVGRYPTARYSLLEIKPITGRRHQIRRHLNHLGHPIVGDAQHGDGEHNRFFRECWGFTGLFLAARSLALLHPFTGEPLRIEAPLAWRLEACLQQLEEFRVAPGKP